MLSTSFAMCFPVRGWARPLRNSHDALALDHDELASARDPIQNLTGIAGQFRRTDSGCHGRKSGKTPEKCVPVRTLHNNAYAKFQRKNARECVPVRILRATMRRSRFPQRARFGAPRPGLVVGCGWLQREHDAREARRRAECGLSVRGMRRLPGCAILPNTSR